MLGAVFDLLVSLAIPALAFAFVASLFLGEGAGTTRTAGDDDNDEADLPPPGIWDQRKAWGRWDGPLERDRYFAARGFKRGEF